MDLKKYKGNDMVITKILQNQNDFVWVSIDSGEYKCFTPCKPPDSTYQVLHGLIIEPVNRQDSQRSRLDRDEARWGAAAKHSLAQWASENDD